LNVIVTVAVLPSRTGVSLGPLPIHIGGPNAHYGEKANAEQTDHSHASDALMQYFTNWCAIA